MRKSKPTIKLTTGFQGHTRTVHWGTYKKISREEGGPLFGGSPNYVPACTEKFRERGIQVLPKGSPYRITCPTCIKHWGDAS